MFEHRDTYGQSQVCSKDHQGSSVDRPCQSSFHWIKFWYVRNPLPRSIRLRLSVLVRYWGSGRVELILDGFRWEKKTNAPITPIQQLTGDSSPLVVINTTTRGGDWLWLENKNSRFYNMSRYILCRAGHKVYKNKQAWNSGENAKNHKIIFKY